MITNEEFRLFRNLIYEESGIYLKETRKDFLENRITKRMNATGMASPYWYYMLINEKSKEELLILLDLLTVNETSFFRNRPQIDLFHKNILPKLVINKEHKGEKRLRIWSSGCSTGEEPYTIAMLIIETITNYWNWDVKIYASDLSLSALEIASKGEYTVDKVHATVDEYYIARYFEKIPSHSPMIREELKKRIFPEKTLMSQRCTKDNENEIARSVSNEAISKDRVTSPSARNDKIEVSSEKRNGNYYRMKNEIKRFIIFDFHNLKNDNGLMNLDIIFCRNVMIYFDEEEQKRLIEKLYRKLNPGGFLLLGHAESLHGWNPGFEFIYDNKGSAYKKSE